jgi:hypothetical protein
MSAIDYAVFPAKFEGRVPELAEPMHCLDQQVTKPPKAPESVSKPSDDNTAATTAAVIAVKPASKSGYFSVSLASKTIIKSSRIPLLDAARRLLDLGFPPNATLVMRHAGSEIDALRAPLAGAAQLSVAEGNRASPHFQCWKAFPRSAVGPPVAQKALAGTKGHGVSHRATRAVS